jgi:ribose/xylose/arabinose/galactoside ABC-type transport system permease subunit
MKIKLRADTEEATAVVRLFVILVIAIVVSGVIAPLSLSYRGLTVALVSFAVELGLVTLGQSLVILTGGIDLSVTGVAAMTGITVGALAAHGAPTVVLVIVGLAVGLAGGLVNGFVVAYVGAPPIMATLGSGILFGGIALGVSGGPAYSLFPSSFVKLGTGTSGIPNQVLLFVIIFALAIVVSKRTRFGRWTYATGTSASASRLSGIPVKSVLVSVYAASGLLAAIAGMVMTARVNSSVYSMGASLILASVTAAVLGGMSVAGGSGSLVGSLLGVLTISMIQSSMTLRGIKTETQSMVVAVLLLVILLSSRVSLRALADRFAAAARGPRGPGASASSHAVRDDPRLEGDHP